MLETADSKEAMKIKDAVLEMISLILPTSLACSEFYKTSWEQKIHILVLIICHITFDENSQF